MRGKEKKESFALKFVDGKITLHPRTNKKHRLPYRMVEGYILARSKKPEKPKPEDLIPSEGN